MVKKKRLDKYFSKRWKEMLGHLKSFTNGQDEEALHELRLSAKKIKALVRLINGSAKNGYNFSTKKIKPLFRQSGAIRTAELNLKTLKENEINNICLRAGQTKIINDEYNCFCKKYKSYKKAIEKLKAQFSKHLPSIKNPDVISYFRKKGSWLNIHFLWPVNAGALHECRMVIKDLIYSVKALPVSLRAKIALNLLYLNKLQEIIGLWHDIEITLDLLKSHNLTNIPGYGSLRCKQDKMLQCIIKEIELFHNKMIINT